MVRLAIAPPGSTTRRRAASHIQANHTPTTPLLQVRLAIAPPGSRASCALPVLSNPYLNYYLTAYLTPYLIPYLTPLSNPYHTLYVTGEKQGSDGPPGRTGAPRRRSRHPDRCAPSYPSIYPSIPIGAPIYTLCSALSIPLSRHPDRCAHVPPSYPSIYPSIPIGAPICTLCSTPSYPLFTPLLNPLSDRIQPLTLHLHNSYEYKFVSRQAFGALTSPIYDPLSSPPSNPLSNLLSNPCTTPIQRQAFGARWRRTSHRCALSDPI